jgi:multidrug efflux pump subunit AcrA (membrane-fusion protein)
MTKVRFKELDPRVLPEMSAKVAFLSRPIKYDEKEPFLGIPVSAVRNSSEGKTVFLIKDQDARAVPVQTGRQWGETIEILSGLNEGDRIVLDPSPELKAGARVKIKE